MALAVHTLIFIWHARVSEVSCCFSARFLRLLCAKLSYFCQNWSLSIQFCTNMTKAIIRSYKLVKGSPSGVDNLIRRPEDHNCLRKVQKCCAMRKEDLASKPKLRTFRLYKKNYQVEPCVTSFMSRKTRSCISQLRCGILNRTRYCNDWALCRKYRAQAINKC